MNVVSLQTRAPTATVVMPKEVRTEEAENIESGFDARRDPDKEDAKVEVGKSVLIDSKIVKESEYKEDDTNSEVDDSVEDETDTEVALLCFDVNSGNSEVVDTVGVIEDLGSSSLLLPLYVDGSRLKMFLLLSMLPWRC
ncbi:hypothetical protein U1Q18_032686 [Sarracenia purpurea var. burkii]